MEGITIRSRDIDQIAGARILEITGYIDTNTSVSLEREISRTIEEGSTHLFLDLANVDYISSAGWGVFITAIRHAREYGGDIRLVAMQPDVHDVFELLEFQSILEAHGSLEEALGAAHAG